VNLGKGFSQSTKIHYTLGVVCFRDKEVDGGTERPGVPIGSRSRSHLAFLACDPVLDGEGRCRLSSVEREPREISIIPVLACELISGRRMRAAWLGEVTLGASHLCRWNRPYLTVQ
jgi:hypothetical protein